MKQLVSALYNGGYPFSNYQIFENLRVETPNYKHTFKPTDALVVWGGEDINPSLYNKGRSSFSHAYPGPHNGLSIRDAFEWDSMKRALAAGTPIIGVCRGAQMLCALAGGTLYQHVNGHSGRHEVSTFDDQKFEVNSIHHQMMNPNGTEHQLVAWSSEIRSRVHVDVDSDGNDIDVEVNIEPEFIYFPAVKGFAIQWHPEMTPESNYSQKYIRGFIETHI